MITLKTKVLLFLAAACGMGIGILAPLSDGLYSAMLLFLFPFEVAAVALAIGMDVNRSAVAKKRIPVRETTGVTLGMKAPMVTSQSVN